MQDRLKELKIRLKQVNDLESAAAVLLWDQATYMPPGGASSRAHQLATLRRIAHDMFIDSSVGRLLDELRSYEESLPYDSDEASLIRVTRRNYEKAVKVPTSFTELFASHVSTSYKTWTEARKADDFSMARPCLERTLELSRQLADFFPGYEHIADPLIDFADYGMKASTLRELFADLQRELLPIVQAITSQPPADDSCLHQQFPEEAQLAFGLDVINRFGYDFTRGRQDKTHHPFTTTFSLGDVRITTRVKENDLSEALFSTMHESGHALYEQGISTDFEGTPLAEGTSSGVHESQSRLWENLVGRSRCFWAFFYPKLQQSFPGELGSVSLERFYRAINKVQRSLIRTDADEVTYNLHVMIRFGLELDLLEGHLSVADLPEAWRERFRESLDIAPPNDSDGVLQDMHWFVGTIGGSFQGYTLGNILSAQFLEKAREAHPEIDEEMERGEFGTLHKWLKDNIYRHGSKYTTSELVERVTGEPLSIEPYIRYLRHKYGELYSL